MVVSLDEIENSKALYEKAKAFFIAKNLPDCVIEISDRRFEEWIIHLTPTDEAATVKRRALRKAERPFISIYMDEDCTHFFFNDSTLLMLQIVESGEILDFRDKRMDDFALDEVRKEFLELKKMLQGK